MASIVVCSKQPSITIRDGYTHQNKPVNMDAISCLHKDNFEFTSDSTRPCITFTFPVTDNEGRLVVVDWVFPDGDDDVRDRTYNRIITQFAMDV